jgi:ABC-2 type transport system permease protein
MAWVFVRLKARLIANGLRGGGKRMLGTVLAAIYGAILAVAGFAALATAGGRRTDSAVVAVLFGAALAVGWAVFPLLGFGSDETLDPTRLELLPLGRRDLMTGLLAASLVGIGPFATLAALAGGVAGFAPPGPGAILVVAAVAIQFVLCIALSRAIVTALSAALRSRKGRDLRVILVTLVALVPQLLRFVFVPAHASLRSLRPLANVVGWLPIALPMRAMVAARDGRLVVAIGELALGGATVVALGWWWAHSLERIATAPEPAATRTRTTRAAPSGGLPGAEKQADPLFGSLLGWLPRNRTGAVAAREVRVSWRDPRRRVQVMSTLLFPFLVMAGIVARGVSHRPSLVYAALLAVALGGARANNQLGMDGRAWWIHEASGADWPSDLGGKNLSVAFTSLPVTVAVAIVLAALGGGWSQLLPVVLLAVALCEVQLAIGNVVSIRAPWAVPASRSNAWAANTGQGCLVGLVGLLALLVMGVLSAPAIVAIAVVQAATGRILIGVASLVYGYGLWRLGLSIAVRAANRRGPELLATLSEGTGAT